MASESVPSLQNKEIHALAWRGRRYDRIAVASCNGEPGGLPGTFCLTERFEDVTCRGCQALELLRDVWRMTADVRPLHPTIERIGRLLEVVDEELGAPLVRPMVRL